MRSLAGDTHVHPGPCDPTSGVRPENENQYGSAHAVGLFTPKGEKAGESHRPSTAEWPILARRSHTVGRNRAIKLADAPWKHCAERNPSRTPRPLAPGFRVSEAPECADTRRHRAAEQLPGAGRRVPEPATGPHNTATALNATEPCA